MKYIGLLINPISGMGGSVGLKGTDGLDILNKAIELGAKPLAPTKAYEALIELKEMSKDIFFYTGADKLGEGIVKELNYNYEVLYKSKLVNNFTTEEDSEKLINELQKKKIDLLIFAGGDGTARLVSKMIGTSIPCIGLPTGVKIHSPVFALTPTSGGKLALDYLKSKIPLRNTEVVDLNEDLYRKGVVVTDLYGYLNTPFKEQYLQNKKSPTPLTKEESLYAIALDIVDNMKENVNYLIGAGSTTSYIMKELGLQNSLLGVDIVRNKQLVASDCNENKILKEIKNYNNKLIITPTGGQGFLFGRGNQQISYKVLDYIGKENIIIISDIEKIIALKGRPLIVYTGKNEVDNYLSGYYRVKTGYKIEMMYRVSNKL